MYDRLKFEIEQNVPELKREIYPTNAPKMRGKPYLVYYKTNSRWLKTLEGVGCGRSLSYIFSVMAQKYEEMNALTKKLEKLLLSMNGNAIGKDKDVHIEELIINNTTETYEKELEMHRGIIDFTIYF